MSEKPTGETAASGGGVTISDSVVAKIAHKAIAGIEGIHAIGGGSARALAGLRGDKGASGITVDLHEGKVDIDVTLSVVFGTNIPQLAEKCRAAISEQVQATTGLPVRAVNVVVNDIVFPEDQAGGGG
jgi:uncharacterized alkaline shock family protein YloU